MVRWHDGLNERQRKFVARYCAHGNAARAYRETYDCSTRAAETAGPRLLRNVQVAKAIQRFQDRAAMRAEVSVAETLARYNRRAKANVQDFVEAGPDGRDRFKPLTSLPRHKVAAVKSLTLEETSTPDGPKVKTKLELYGSKESDDAIMKHLGGFVERKEVTGKDGGPIEVADISTLTSEQRSARLEELLGKLGRKRLEALLAKMDTDTEAPNENPKD